ncbi:MAG: hypothetical protein H7Y22_02630 [Gemmatimonadaceae bacterium]|nr:hypothetical protein [Gloeobacterales cyanobacterium ES-bin-141]
MSLRIFGSIVGIEVGALFADHSELARAGSPVALQVRSWLGLLLRRPLPGCVVLEEVSSSHHY